MYFRNADTRYFHKQHRLWFRPIGFLRLLIMEAAHTLYTPIGELQAEKRTRSSRKQHFLEVFSTKAPIKKLQATIKKNSLQLT